MAFRAIKMIQFKFSKNVEHVQNENLCMGKLNGPPGVKEFSFCIFY